LKVEVFRESTATVNWLVQDRGNGQRMVEVIFVKDAPPATTIYVIHAMPITTRRRRGR
jgi:hypothetical protein